MSRGDILFGKKTIYKGIEMKSNLETKIAFFLDSLKIKWEYEPKRFRLSDGTFYIPDFYLPELKIWIEGKGRIEEHNKKISKMFIQETHEELILLSGDEFYYYDLMCGECDEIMIGLCESCGKYYFCSRLGNYVCKSCWKHNGDHNFHHDKPIFKEVWKEVYDCI